MPTWQNKESDEYMLGYIYITVTGGHFKVVGGFSWQVVAYGYIRR